MGIRDQGTADVCLILEGTYPYVMGGVSGWTHDLLHAQKDIRFHLLAIQHQEADLTLRYELPENVVSLTLAFVQDLPAGSHSRRQSQKIISQLYTPLRDLHAGCDLSVIADILEIFSPLRKSLGRESLLNSRPAWDLLLKMYNAGYAETSFLDFFWTWRISLAAFYSMMLVDIPVARVYHAVSTGYAGLLAARAHLETGRPALLTEHGIYTTERRIEIAMADWLYEVPSSDLSIANSRRDLKDIWTNTFVSYSHACYQASSKIISLFTGNQSLQIEDGADPEKLEVIPNGIDYKRYAAIQKTQSDRPTIAFIGRVVPIKDVKTFIRACAILAARIPDLQALIMGPTDEDEEYFEECQSIVGFLGIHDTLRFAGKVRLTEHLGYIQAIALTSISEAQPLVILEAGAARVPSVATDVGACREMILGAETEAPPLGPGGAITPLSNPTATADALTRLLIDKEWHAQCSHAIQERVRRYYQKSDLDETYRRLYKHYASVPDMRTSYAEVS